MTPFLNGQVERNQAALEAVEVLTQAGFVIEDFDVDTDSESSAFELDLTMHLGVEERPLEVVK